MSHVNHISHALRLFLWMFVLSLPVSIFALEVSEEDQLILEKFFRTLFLKSEGGYVFCGSKPVCINGYEDEEQSLPGYPRHETAVYLREGAKVWNKLGLHTRKNGNLILHIYRKNDSLVPNVRHILVINREKFLDIVARNISLFQYVLGPAVNGEQLLSKLIDPDETFHGILKADKTLIGIILGFGARNSIYVSRVENLAEGLFAPPSPPYLPLLSGADVLSSRWAMYRELLLVQDKYFNGTPVTGPSFGFNSSWEELDILTAQLEVSSEKLVQNEPSFIFGKVKGDHDADALITRLESNQVLINHLLDSESFFENILTMFIDDSITLRKGKVKLLSFDKKEINSFPLIISKRIKKNLFEESQNYVDFFLKGMYDANRNLPCMKEIKGLQFYDKNKALLKIKKNTEETNIFFKNLEHQEAIQNVIPEGVLCRTLLHGNGAILENQDRVLMDYTVWIGLTDAPLSDSTSEEADLSKMIGGIVHGMKGMREGEMREIFIHPNYAYGIYTPFEKGKHLRARVQLLKILPSENSQCFQILKSHEIEKELATINESEFLEQDKQAGYLNGYRIWSHFKDSDYYSLEQIINLLKNPCLYQRADSFSLEKEEKDLLNKLHWNLYAKKSSK